jgi:hypothetical protein
MYVQTCMYDTERERERHLRSSPQHSTYARQGARGRDAAGGAKAEHAPPRRLRGRLLDRNRRGSGPDARAMGPSDLGRRSDHHPDSAPVGVARARPTPRSISARAIRARLGGVAQHPGVRAACRQLAHRPVRRTALQAPGAHAALRHPSATGEPHRPRSLGRSRARASTHRAVSPRAGQPPVTARAN